MTLRFHETSDKVIVSFTDTQIPDEDWIHETGRGLLDICKRSVTTSKRLIVDFSGIQFISSGMIGQLVQLCNVAKQHSLELRVANMSANVLKLFKITRLIEAFRRADDGPDLFGAGVPNPNPPRTLNGGAKPPLS